MIWRPRALRAQRTPQDPSGGGDVEEALPSLDVLFDELHRQEESYERRVALLNTASALVITAAGVTIAFRATQPTLLGVLAQVLAVAAIAMTFRSALPRLGNGLDLRALRDRYLTAEPAVTKLAMFDTSLSLREGAEASLTIRLSRIKQAGIVLVAAVALAVLGSIVNYGQSWWRNHESHPRHAPITPSAPARPSPAVSPPR